MHRQLLPRRKVNFCEVSLHCNELWYCREIECKICCRYFVPFSLELWLLFYVAIKPKKKMCVFGWNYFWFLVVRIMWHLWFNCGGFYVLFRKIKEDYVFGAWTMWGFMKWPWIELLAQSFCVGIFSRVWNIYGSQIYFGILYIVV